METTTDYTDFPLISFTLYATCLKQYKRHKKIMLQKNYSILPTFNKLINAFKVLTLSAFPGSDDHSSTATVTGRIDDLCWWNTLYIVYRDQISLVKGSCNVIGVFSLTHMFSERQLYGIKFPKRYRDCVTKFQVNTLVSLADG